MFGHNALRRPIAVICAIAAVNPVTKQPCAPRHHTAVFAQLQEYLRSTDLAAKPAKRQKMLAGGRKLSEDLRLSHSLAAQSLTPDPGKEDKPR